MTKNLKKLLFLLVLFTSIGMTQTFAQKKSKSKAKTHKVHKVNSSSSDNGEYYNGHKIYTGPRGGRYYINKNGNKTYI
jgi:colicin import membrane protein